MKKTAYPLLLSFLLTSCSLLSPGHTENPNVEQSDFAQTPGAMTIWVNGVNANFATAQAKFAEFTSLLSDDMKNNSSRSAKTYDVLDILYTDGEVSVLSTHIGKMIEMTTYGLNTLAESDASTTDAQLFNLRYVRTVAYLWAAENFVALPNAAHGDVLTGTELAAQAADEARRAGALAQTADDRALALLLEARALYDAGRLSDAATVAQQSLAASPTLCRQVQFDALNGFANPLHEYAAAGLFTVLPRLQYQLPGKFPMADYWNQPIAVAKAEEAYLIVAEAEVQNGNLPAARQALADLLALVHGQRDASVSAVSVEAADLTDAASRTEAMALIYLLRQEVFFGEARRSSDLGIRLPISEVEFNEYGNLPDAYRHASIPNWLYQIRNEIDQREDLNEVMAGQ